MQRLIIFQMPMSNNVLLPSVNEAEYLAKNAGKSGNVAARRPYYSEGFDYLKFIWH